MGDDAVSHDTILKIAQQANLEDEPEVQKLLRAAAATNNATVRRRIKKVLEVRAAHRRSYPFDERDTAEEIRLGETPAGKTVGLDPGDLTKHVLVTGQSGAGKTTLFYNVMRQLEVPFWTFDLKQDYRHLASERSDLLVLPWDRVRFNPLQPPPDVPPRRWAQVFAEVFGHATALLSGSKNYLLKRLVDLYQSHNDTGSWPTLETLHHAIEEDTMNYMQKSSNYRETVLNRLDGVLLSSDDMFTASEGLVQPSLLEENVVFELDGLTNDTQNFLMELLFAYVYEYRLAQAQRGGGLRHIFFLDEGKRVFSVYKERQDAAGMPTIDELTAKMREFGEGLVVADQEPGKLTDSIKANTEVKILLSMGERTQFKEMAESMHLTRRQQDQAKQLGTGQAIVQQENTPPLPVDLEHYEVRKSVDDDRLVSLQQSAWSRLADRINTENDGMFRRGEDIGDRREKGETVAKPGEEKETGVSLSEEEDALLRDVVDRPFAKLSERYEQLSSVNKGNEAKQGLLEKGLVRERPVSAVRGRMKLLEVTDAGRSYLEDRGVSVDRDGRGSVVHRYWQHEIRDALERWGWATELEVSDADVGAEGGGVSVPVEVAMRAADREVDHVKQRVNSGFDAVVVACRNESIRDSLEEKMSECTEGSKSVSLLGFHEFLGDSPEAEEVFTELREGEIEDD